MTWESSTQANSWLFTKEQLNTKRVAQHSALSGKNRQLNAEEQADLLHYYEHRIHEFVLKTLELNNSISHTAIIYFKRFFLEHNICTVDIKNVLLTCIYLACKTEEKYLAASSLCKCWNKQEARHREKAILQLEMNLLLSIKFHLIVHHPRAAVRGFFENFMEQAKKTDKKKFKKLRNDMLTAVDALQFTDAPLIYPPSILALACLRYSGKKNKLASVDTYIDKILRGNANSKPTILQMVDDAQQMISFSTEINQEKFKELEKRYSLARVTVNENGAAYESSLHQESKRRKLNVPQNETLTKMGDDDSKPITT